jgi:hypothetical protein
MRIIQYITPTLNLLSAYISFSRDYYKKSLSIARN